MNPYAMGNNATRAREVRSCMLRNKQYTLGIPGTQNAAFIQPDSISYERSLGELGGFLREERLLLFSRGMDQHRIPRGARLVCQTV